MVDAEPQANDVVALFANEADLEFAVAKLRLAGFRNADLSVGGLSIAELEAKRFKGLVKEGRNQLSVHCDGPAWVAKAKDIVQRCGGRGAGAP